MPDFNSVAPDNPFSISAKELDDFNVDQATDDNFCKLQEFGGLEALCKALQTDPKKGLSADEDTTPRKSVFGENRFPEVPPKSWLTLYIESFNDIVLLILIVAAVVSLVIGLIEDPEKGWIEGVAILLAVQIVAVVTATNDSQKEKQFRKLSSVKDDILVKVMRGGQQSQVSIHELVVGDVVVMETGDKVPADCVFAEGYDVTSNESSLTGEPEDLKKSDKKDPFLLSGCSVTAGHCSCVVIAVGANSRWGRIKAKLVTAHEDTPLQEKLDDMAMLIGYVGTGAAVATFVAMLVVAAVSDNELKESDSTSFWVKTFMHAFIIAVTIIVVAIPEGLPLAVTISLAYSTQKMMQDQNLIRVLAACETMGNATNICSDKTGTLTLNQMTVTAGWFAGQYFEHASPPRLPAAADIDGTVLKSITDNFCLNSTATLAPDTDNPEGGPKVVGSKTEGALLMLAQQLGVEYAGVRDAAAVEKVFMFSSARKMMSVLVQLPDGAGYRLYCKGASEIVLRNCSSAWNGGEAAALDDARRGELEGHVVNMADNALRTLGIAHRDFDAVPEDLDAPPEEDMTLDAIVGIIDPLRHDVPDAVATCQRAGVFVRMVTGDNIRTAQAIARQCGILTEGEAIEGPTFRMMKPVELDNQIPRLQVLARSSPDDKHTLVTRLNGAGLPKDKESWQEVHPGRDWDSERDLLLPGYREEWEASRPGGVGEVVGVTGDGTNDAPALKAADVGLSMGLSGTEVAKDASDIVILDDRFSSIVQAVKWGRSVYDNIRRFLQFQLTVNVVALLLVFIAALIGQAPPLNAVMMLWVNLIMDTMGALALGTEQPTLDLLDRRPYKRNAKLVSKPMWRNILCQSLWQLIMLLGLLYTVPDMFDVPPDETCRNLSNAQKKISQYTKKGIESYSEYEECESLKDEKDDDAYWGCRCAVQGEYAHFTIIFNAFVFCQIFNEFNARSIKHDGMAAFRGLSKNMMFNGVIVTTVALQLFIVEFGGDFTRTSGLPLDQWLVSVALGFVAIPVGLVMRLIPIEEDEEDYATGGVLRPPIPSDGASSGASS